MLSGKTFAGSQFSARTIIRLMSGVLQHTTSGGQASSGWSCDGSHWSTGTHMLPWSVLQQTSSGSSHISSGRVCAAPQSLADTH